MPLLPLEPTAQRGFTLIEIMVVVVIIGIMATFATLSLGNRTSSGALDTEAHRLEQLFLLAQEQAELGNVQYGFRYTDTGYGFVSLNSDGVWTWRDSGPLRRRALTEPLQLTLRVEGNIIPPAQDIAPGSSDTATLKPQVLVLSSGELSDFVLDLATPGVQDHFRLRGDVIGTITLERYDPDRPT